MAPPARIASTAEISTARDVSTSGEGIATRKQSCKASCHVHVKALRCVHSATLFCAALTRNHKSRIQKLFGAVQQTPLPDELLERQCLPGPLASGSEEARHYGSRTRDSYQCCPSTKNTRTADTQPRQFSRAWSRKYSPARTSKLRDPFPDGRLVLSFGASIPRFGGLAFFTSSLCIRLISSRRTQ